MKALKADRDGMVQLKAIGFGTINGPTGNILHADDRDAADKLARYPRVGLADAQRMVDMKLAEPFSGEPPEDDGDVVGMDVGERAGEYAGHYAKQDDSVDASTGLDTRQSTVFEGPIESLAAAGGAKRAIITADDGTNTPAVEPVAPARGRVFGDARQDFTRPPGGGQQQPLGAPGAAAPAPAPRAASSGGGRSRSRSRGGSKSGGSKPAAAKATAPAPASAPASSGSDSSTS
jgi:hypothetical protein